jgi:hypothetical protein
VNFKRDGNTIKVQCESEAETAKAFSFLLATGILSGGDLAPYPKAILSDLDSLAKELETVSRAAQLRMGIAASGTSEPRLESPDSKNPLPQALRQPPA